MKLKHKKAAGFVVMILCWLIGGATLIAPNSEKPPAPAPNTAAPQIPIGNHSATDRSVEELPLPTQAEIIGIEFALFEPIPERVKINGKRRK